MRCGAKWMGWLGEAKVLCIFQHQGIQLRLNYSWARPAVLAECVASGLVYISSVSSLSFTFPPFYLSSTLLFLL